jgi:hypothetical protein
VRGLVIDAEFLADPDIGPTLAVEVTAGIVGAMPNGRQIRVRAVRRDKPDLERFAQALVELARAQVAANNDQHDRAA